VARVGAARGRAALFGYNSYFSIDYDSKMV